MRIFKSFWCCGSVLVGFVLGFCFLIQGCGPSAGTLSEVKGSVELDGKPLPGGTLKILIADHGYSMDIQGDGTFKFVGVKLGEAKVLIETESVKNIANANLPDDNVLPGEKDTNPKDKLKSDVTDDRKYVKIPSDYANYDKSGLTWTIGSGLNEKKFSLKSDYKFQK